MAKIDVTQGAGAEPRTLVDTFVQGQDFPFIATITHKAKKPLVVPSTGLNDVILPGKAVTFKVKSFDQAWTVVTDLAALAERYNSKAEDFATLSAEDVPAVVAEAPAEGAAEEKPSATPTKAELAVAAKATAAASK